MAATLLEAEDAIALAHRYPLALGARQCPSEQVGLAGVDVVTVVNEGVDHSGRVDGEGVGGIHESQLVVDVHLYAVQTVALRGAFGGIGGVDA